MSGSSRRRPALRFTALAALLALACGGEAEPASDLPAARVADGPHDLAVVDMGALGEIRIELLPELAPRTVARFAERARAGHYDSTTFHRVIPGFMIQGGSPWTRDADPRNDANNDGGPAVPDELSDFPHVRGTVSFANQGRPDTGRVQFFIVHGDQPELDGRYAAFGRVVRGMEVVDAIASLEIDTYGRYGPPDRPHPVDARIERIRIVPAGERTPDASLPDAARSLDPLPANG